MDTVDAVSRWSPFSKTATASTTIFAYVVCFAYIANYIIADKTSIYLSWTVLVAVCIKIIQKGRVESLDFSLSLGLGYLILVPSISSLLKKAGGTVIVAAISLPLFDIIITFVKHLHKGMVSRQSIRIGKNDFVLWIGLIAMTIINGAVFGSHSSGIVSLFVYSLPFSLSLVFFERICQKGKTLKIFIMLGIYGFSIYYYAIAYWSGFGRLMLGAYILIPLLIANSYRDIGLSVWQAVIISPIAILGAGLIRDPGYSIDRLHEGSGAGHLAITQEMLNTIEGRIVPGWSAYWDQIALILLQWMPRDWWHNKPLGVGYTFVDDWLGRRGYGLEHNVATGYLGEQLYLLGDQAWFGLLISVSILIIIRYTMTRVSKNYVSPIIVFDTIFITYIWGGGAAFGARFWFIAIPMIFLIHIIKK